MPAVPAILLCLSCLSAPAPGEALAQRLAGGQPLSLVFLGDSITTAMNVEHPAGDGFPALFARMLAERWPAVKVTAHNLGVPGQRSGDALDSFDQRVLPLKPNLVVLQFGGNDKGVDAGLANLPAFEEHLRALVERCWKAGAACLLVTPPMREPQRDMPFPWTARKVGERLRVPVADIDTALKQEPKDYRGFFPYFVHPREPEHAIMATELYRAFCELIGRPLDLGLSFPRAACDAALGGPVTALLRVTNQADTAREVKLSGSAPRFADMAVTVAAGATVEAAGSLVLPHTLSGGRSMEWPLWARADSGSQTAFALARATVVPIVACPALGTPAAGIPLVRLTGAQLVLGQDAWGGDEDLSADVYLAANAESVQISVDVTDDVVTNRGAPTGDGVEVFLDLRDDAERGRPWFASTCATLFINPPSRGHGATLTTPGEDEPAAALLKLPVGGQARPHGYRCTLMLPRQVLDQVAGRHVTAFGLDVAVDDSDGGGRKTQLMWLGRADNFVNPRRLGELRLDQPVAPGAVRVTVF